MIYLISEFFKRIFYPDDFGCIVCSKRGLHRAEHSNAVICDECYKTIKLVSGAVCIKCGRQLGISDSYCENCAKHDFEFDNAASAYCYEGAMRELIHKLKYSGEQWIAELMSGVMYDVLLQKDWEIDVIAYVPMYRSKQRARGYNQAELLAKGVAKRKSIECVELLKRIKNTTPQSKLDKDERMLNIKDAIEVNKNIDIDVNGKNVLVIDDILTTGSSLNECARVLKANGANKVFGLCLCSVKE